MSKMAKGEPTNEQIPWGVSWADDQCEGIILDGKTILVISSNCMNIQRRGQRSIDLKVRGNQEEQQQFIIVETIILPQMNQDRGAVPVQNNFATHNLPQRLISNVNINKANFQMS